jgi:hypothetical protein
MRIYNMSEHLYLLLRVQGNLHSEMTVGRQQFKFTATKKCCLVFVQPLSSKYQEYQDLFRRLENSNLKF